jgi:predicted DNA-binding transcriptional regulator AlpA
MDTPTPLRSLDRPIRMPSSARLQENRLLRLRQVLALVPVSKSTWWSWVASGKAPKAIKLSERTTVWRASDIMDFLTKVQGG